MGCDEAVSLPQLANSKVRDKPSRRTEIPRTPVLAEFKVAQRYTVQKGQSMNMKDRAQSIHIK